MAQLGGSTLQAMSEKKELRGYVSADTNRLFRAVVALKDTNLSDALAEAVEEWLNKPENREIIQRHNLKLEE
jgi:glycosyltransferase involved in cell wall biosynthesis